MIYSSWIDLTSWSNFTAFGIRNYYFDIPASQLTQERLDTGVVLVYAKLNEYVPEFDLTDKPVLLPHVVVSQIGGATYTDHWESVNSPGNIRVLFKSTDPRYSTIFPVSNYSFRYVIIPGGVAASSLTDFSYEAVAKRFNIQD